MLIAKETINQGKHHFLVLKDENKSEIGTTLWNYGPESLEGKRCTIIFGIFKDTYRERNEIKIKINEIFYHFCTKSSKAYVRWIFIAHLNSD